MTKMIRVITTVSIVALLALGCSSDRNEGIFDNAKGVSSAITLPDGAVLTSATFYVYVTQFSNQPVTLHRVTADWDEATVTWNSFGGAYDGAVQGSFNCDNLGWKSADITALVQSWIDGTNDNYGLLMDQAEVYYAIATYHSREAAAILPPYLEVCYDLDGVNYCVEQAALADAFIRQYYADVAFGLEEWLDTGWGALEYLEKQSLVRFDFEVPPPEDSSYGCTRTIGYWKTHSGFGPQADMVSQYLPIWLGDAGGAKSIHVTTNADAHNILTQHVYCDPDNGITKLYAQLLGAKLNEAAGADIEDVAAVFAKADEFLAMYNCTDWEGLSNHMKKKVLLWHDKLDRYNNGLIGPGHCDDDIFIGM